MQKKENYKELAINLSNPLWRCLKNSVELCLRDWESIDKDDSDAVEDFYRRVIPELADGFWFVYKERFLNGGNNYVLPEDAGSDLPNSSKGGKESCFDVTFNEKKPASKVTAASIADRFITEFRSMVDSVNELRKERGLEPIEYGTDDYDSLLQDACSVLKYHQY